MKSFFKSFGIVLVLTIAGMILATAAPHIGVWVGLAFLVIPFFAIFKPLPQLHLGHRAFSAFIAFFVGLLTTAASFGFMSDTQRLADLREADPTAYLSELEGKNQTQWLAELEQLAPERHALETAKIAEDEAIRQVEAAALRAAEDEEKVTAYIEQLDREIASIPSVQASNYTEDVTTINTGLLLIRVWSLLYEEGGNLDLNEEAQQKRQQFRQLVVRKQTEMLPTMRDDYGPAMRQQLWEADGSARTIGAGYRTVEFVSAAFARNANIQQIHLELRENLMMLRFTRAQYKWFERASDFSYYTLEVPRDSDIVKWGSNGRYTVLD